MTRPEQVAQAPVRKPMTLILTGGIAGIAVGLAAVYGIASLQRNAGDAACRPAVEMAQRVAPLARGEVAAFTPAEQPLRIPDLGFRDGSGDERHLREWHGRTVLLNLWATWCVPCRKEMPALDALQAELGSDAFQVVAINIDTRDPEKPRKWLAETGIGRLGFYADPSARVFQDLKMLGRAAGMPTTLLVDAAGCEVGTMAGPAEWASDDALKLVRAAL
ncbi:MAG: thiol:disulfide interchange protein TlpA [Xanthobacteraceae bacterium]